MQIQSLKAQRVDQVNGYKPKIMLTRMEEITFEVPQARAATDKRLVVYRRPACPRFS